MAMRRLGRYSLLVVACTALEWRDISHSAKEQTRQLRGTGQLNEQGCARRAAPRAVSCSRHRPSLCIRLLYEHLRVHLRADVCK